MKITSIKTRGILKGRTMTPHKFRDGKYVASKTRYEKDYVRVDTIDELIPLLKAGHRIRMSVPNEGAKENAPTGISLENLVITK